MISDINMEIEVCEESKINRSVEQENFDLSCIRISHRMAKARPCTPTTAYKHPSF
jgi:hypothetical protein